jgi:Sulfate permease family
VPRFVPEFSLKTSIQTHTRVYVEQDPTVGEWIKENAPTRKKTVGYLRSLLPCLEWLPRYNRIWLLGDLIAGVTIGAVVVPQGMAYAKLANLPPQYGLYSSFVGVLIYFAFATSKEYAFFLPTISCSLPHPSSSVLLSAPSLSCLFSQARSSCVSNMSTPTSLGQSSLPL